MEFEDILKLILFLAFFVLPPLARAMDEKRKASGGGLPKPPQTRKPVRPGQTLAEWIEEVRRAQEERLEESAPEPPPTVIEVQQPARREAQVPTPRQEQVPTPREVQRSRHREGGSEHIHPVTPQVHAHTQTLEPHVAPVKAQVHADYEGIHSRFDEEGSTSAEASSSPDGARRAKPAKRARREGGRVQRARRASSRGRAAIRIHKGNLRRAMILKEILDAPLALRDNGNL